MLSGFTQLPGQRRQYCRLAPSEEFGWFNLSQNLKAVYVFGCTHTWENLAMTTSTTMTIRLDPQLKAKLGRLADGTRRSRSFLAAEAVESYVDRELAIIEGIERGLADVEAGRTVSHEDAMASVRQVIDTAAGKTA